MAMIGVNVFSNLKNDISMFCFDFIFNKYINMHVHFLFNISMHI